MLQQEQFKEEEISLINLLIIVVKYRWMIIFFTLFVSIVVTIYSLTLHNKYLATATILPPTQQGGSTINSIGSQGAAGLIALAGADLGISKNPSDLYIGMLKSKTISDEIIEKFDLKKVYKEEYMSNVRSMLASITFFEIERKNGLINISVEGEDREKIVAMANEYVKLLEELNNKLVLTAAKREKKFLENRLKVSEKDFNQAQEKLLKFQEENKAISLNEQGAVAITVASNIQVSIFATEVELKSLQTILSPDNTKIISLKAKIAELKKQLKNIEGNKNKSLDNFENTNIFYTPINGIPSLGLKYSNLLRDVKIQETIFELLTRQYEAAKINEAKESMNIQVLDYAQVPELIEKVKPDRLKMVLNSAFIALFLSLLMAFSIEVIKNLKQKNVKIYNEIYKIKETLINDILFFRKK